METTLDIKKRIHDFVDQADERILRIFNAIISTEESELEGLSSEHKIIIDERLQEHKENPTSGKSWIDVKQELKKEYEI